MRANLVEDEYYQIAAEFPETSLRPDIGVACAGHVIILYAHPSAADEAQKRVLGIG